MGLPAKLTQPHGRLPEIFDIPLIARKQHGKGGQQAFLRLQPMHLAKSLGVRDNEPGRLPQGGEGAPVVRRGAADGRAALVQKLPQGLHLGQDQASLGCLDILGHHQEHSIACLGQSPRNAALLEILRQLADDFLPQLRNAAPAHGADANRRIACFLPDKLRQSLAIVPQRIRTADDRYGRRILCPELFHPVQLRHHVRIAEEHNGYIRFPCHIPGTVNPQLAQLPLIIEPRRIHKNHRADAFDLHGLIYGIRSRAGHGGDRCRMLSGQGIHQRGLAAVALAVKADMQAAPPGSILKPHTYLTPQTRETLHIF